MQSTLPPTGDMFIAFLNAYERGRKLARAQRAGGATDLYRDEGTGGVTPGTGLPEHVITLDELVQGLPELDAFHHGAGAAHILWAFAQGLLSRPSEERREIIEHAKRDLVTIGLSEQQIDAFDPTTDNLKRVITRLTPLTDLHTQRHPGEFVRLDEAADARVG